VAGGGRPAIVTRLAYTIMLYAALPYVLLRLLWRGLRQPAYLRHVAERFGFYRSDVVAAPLIWIHAVSVGETRAAEPLIHALRRNWPQTRILLTHTTPTGREAGEALFGDTVLRCYLPYDYPGAVARFLGRFRPLAGMLMETELWPNLIHVCGRRGVPLYLVNARLSEKSFGRYRRAAALTRACLDGLAAVAAQTADDASRFAALSAGNVAVTGNLKFDVAPSPVQGEMGRSWRAGYGPDRRVLLAASTRDGEEALLLDAVDSMKLPRLLTVIVPRHPQRFDEVAALLERRGLKYQRRSADAMVAHETQVLLGDSMGEMAAYYAACDVAFVGGSLLPFGGQNLIEACAAGKPVLIGPHTYNFAEAAESAVAAGAAVRVADTMELANAAQRILTDTGELARMGAAGLKFAAAHRGATLRVLELLRLGDS
jgi:3-deoxy-D-manno-octulosonic-acid transferase